MHALSIAAAGVVTFAMLAPAGPRLSADGTADLKVHATTTSDAVYEVYAIKYAVIPDFPVSGLVAGADAARRMDIDMMVWLLRGANGRNVLVDSGFFREKFFKEWTIRNFVKPSDAVRRLGLQPEQITDIVITRMHWDHAGGVELFPNARV